MKKIKLTDAERQSKQTRQDWAEGLILQLPKKHEGRNSWLLNYGCGYEAIKLREKAGLGFDEKTRACKTYPDNAL
jgi:hypothetical protein